MQLASLVRLVCVVEYNPLTQHITCTGVNSLCVCLCVDLCAIHDGNNFCGDSV